MPNYRRYYIPGSTIFITCVTYNRIPIFSKIENLELLKNVTRNVKRIHPFQLLAYVLMSDHFHWMICLPDQQSNFSRVLQSVKWNFTLEYKKKYSIHRQITLWQRGFWDHVIRDDVDFSRHLNYIHWNPIKHEIVQNPEEWGFSSFKYWVKKGFYEPGWGQPEEMKGIVDLDYE